MNRPTPDGASPRSRPRPRSAPVEPAVIRRRRVALAALAALAALLGAIAGAGSDSAERAAESPAAGPHSCPVEIAGDTDRLIGQLLVVRMEDSPGAELLERAQRGELGGVILFPTAEAGERELRRAIARLDEAALVGGFPAPLVAIDQEGGEVKRLPEAPPELAPAEIARRGGAAVAEEQGRRTGRALRELGIDIDLAPVLDAPTSPSSFIASRSFSSEPALAGELGSRFAAGLAEAGVAATAKHFPGLGPAIANTDLEPSAVEPPAAVLDAALEPFRIAIEAGIPLMMTANAVYPAYDDVPASLSGAVSRRLLRDRLGFEGVVVTDDLGAGAVVAAGYSEGEAALAAARAGADLLLFALSDGAAAARSLRRGLRRGELERADLIASCERLTALRASLAEVDRDG